jgi:transposase
VALGRKSFLFVHSEEVGKELALLYSLVVSCTRVGVNPVEYLADVLDRIDKTADGDYAELLPDRWNPPPKTAGPNETSLFDASPLDRPGAVLQPAFVR